MLGLARNPALERAAGPEIERAERQFRRTGQPQRVFGSFAYAAGTWDRQRRVIVKAEHTAQGPNPRFVVTNLPGDPQELYEEVYCRAARWRTGSRSSNWSCSPTGRVATGSWPTSSGCC